VNIEYELKKCLLYNPASGAVTWLVQRSNNVKIGGNAGSKAHNGYIKMSFMGKTLSVHRVAWLLHYGSWPSLCIDHINGDRADNRIENLRDVSLSINAMNRHVIVEGKRRKKTTGITQHKSGKWMVQIYCAKEKKLKYYGVYQDKSDAISVADRILKIDRSHL
jgi:hypothetical protein